MGHWGELKTFYDDMAKCLIESFISIVIFTIAVANNLGLFHKNWDNINLRVRLV